MKKLLFTLLLFCFALTGFAQKSKEVLYLKNGSIIKGTTVELIPNETLKFRTADDSLLVYAWGDVDRLVRAKNDYELWRQRNSRLRKGYRGMVEQYFLGFIYGLSTSHGYQFNPYIFLGGGVGGMLNIDIDRLFIPVFLHFRYDALNKKVSPYIDLKTGYSPGEGLNVYLSSTIGMRIMIGGKRSIGLGSGFSLQQTQSYSNDAKLGVHLKCTFSF